MNTLTLQAKLTHDNGTVQIVEHKTSLLGLARSFDYLIDVYCTNDTTVELSHHKLDWLGTPYTFDGTAYICDVDCDEEDEIIRI